MNKILPLLLMGCVQAQPTETVKSLESHPEWLKKLRQRCKQDRSRPGDELCNRVAEATNKRF